MSFSSKYIEEAVEHISKLPGIGKKSATRLALFLLNQEADDVKALTEAIDKMKSETLFCSKCHNISDTPICEICSNPTRSDEIICVVEDIRDVMAIENTHNFKGKYHVLGGLISPMDGIGPSDLTIDSLVSRAREGGVSEIIFALNSTMEGDTTTFYLYRKLGDFDVQLSTLARGLSVGDSLEYADEVTLSRSIQNRIPYETSIQQNRS